MGCFSPGQAYVALSHVTTYENLHILHYDWWQIKANKAVTTEMKNLQQKWLPHFPCPVILNSNMNACLRFGHLNMQGLKCKKWKFFPDLQLDDVVQALDVLYITETHASVVDEISERMISSTSSYAIICKDHDSHGGGVLIAGNNNHPSQLHYIDSELEVVGVQVTLPNHQCVNIFAVYIPPCQDKKQASMILANLIELFITTPMIIVGDFNEDIPRSSPSSFNSSLTELGFQQLVTWPTTDYGTLIDHMYSNIDIDYIEVNDIYYSAEQGPEVHCLLLSSALLSAKQIT